MKKILLFVFISLLLPTAHVHAALTDNIISYYKFQGNPTDELGAYNGTNGGGTGPAYSTSFGYIGQGVKSVGDNAGFPSPSYITTGTGPNLTGDFSIGFWMRNATNVAGFNVIYSIDSKAGVQNGQVEIYFSGSTAPQLSARSGPSTNAVVAASTVANTSTWHYYTFTRNGTNLAVYVDGVFDNQVAWSTAQKANLGLGATFFAFSTFFDNGWTGETDEWGIWSRALSSTEVATLYNLGAGCQYPFSGCVAVAAPKFNFWQFFGF